MTDKRFGIEQFVGKEICYFLKDNYRNYTNADTTTQTYKFGVSGTKESAMEVAYLLNELYEKEEKILDLIDYMILRSNFTCEKNILEQLKEEIKSKGGLE